MSLSRLEYEFEDTAVKARIVVCKADVLRGLLRSQLTDEGLRHEDDNPLIHVARWTQYPALRAATVEGEITIFDVDEKTGERVKGKILRTIDPSRIEFEDFLSLPEDFATGWLDRVFDLNTHWLLAVSPTPDPGTEEGKEPA